MDVRMGQNDSELLLEGEEPAVRRARRVIDSLQQQYSRERSLDEQQIRYAVDMAHKEADDEIRRLMNEILLVTQSGRSLKAKTQGQARYIRAIRENDIVFGIGPAGTGKTYLAMAMAVDAYRKRVWNALYSHAPRWKPEKPWVFFPAICRRRSTPICVLYTMPCSTSWVLKPLPN